jgi:amidase
VTTSRDLCFTPAVQLLKLYRARKVSPLEVMQAVLARIDAVNPQVNAVVTLAREAALRDARRATGALRRSGALPPLFGVPVGIKDVTVTRGIRTTFGSKLFDSHVPDEDALVVERLRRAGAIVIGKTNTPEFAFGPNTVNQVFGATRNPWNLALTAGGSSGGSAAALATGMCPLAEGTDLGGSLRGPASHCGVVGFRTTPGLIPRHPSVLAWDTYSVEGPMARTVADTALMLSVMAGADDRAPLSYDVDPRAFGQATRAPSVKGWRVAWTSDLGGLSEIDDQVRAVFEPAVSVFKAAGARLEAACPDLSDVPEIVRLTRGLLMVARHADKLPTHRAVLQPGLVENTEQGLALSAVEVARGELLRTRQWHRVREFLADRDLLITPTSATPPFPVDQPHALEINGRPVGKMLQRSYLTYAFSVLGLPAISIPCGFTSQGLPVGLQIVGRRHGEAAVLRAAAAFEAIQPWADRVPPIVERLGLQGISAQRDTGSRR